MKLTELYDFITEGTANRDYSCLMLDLDFLKNQILELQEAICPCEVYEEESGKGLEDEFHITVLYGLHCQKAYDITSKIDLKPCKFKIKNISTFENEKFDVLKFGIESEDLKKLNAEVCEKFEYTNSFPDYKPHATIAYLLPKMGDYYTKMKSELIGKEFTSNRFVFSNKFGDKVYITVS